MGTEKQAGGRLCPATVEQEIKLRLFIFNFQFSRILKKLGISRVVRE